METKTISGCLSAIDFAIVENVRLIRIKDLEKIHNSLLVNGTSDYIKKGSLN